MCIEIFRLLHSRILWSYIGFHRGKLSEIQNIIAHIYISQQHLICRLSVTFMNKYVVFVSVNLTFLALDLIRKIKAKGKRGF